MTFRQIYILLPLLVLLLVACDNDDANEIYVEANAGTDLTGTIESLISLDASQSEGANLSYAWSVIAPDGESVTVNGAGASMANFRASQTGTYSATLTVTEGGATNSDEISIVIANVNYAQEDVMGRPGINTVFNFFGDADAKNGYNQGVPSLGSANAEAFEGIFQALQQYIGLDPAAYENVLELDNETTASVLAVDVLNCNKDARSTYGPSDLSNIELFSNVLNGRRLQDDVIDVTLILAFFGDGNTGNALVPGLISDNVQQNDKEFLGEFPYLAAPH